MTRAKPIKAVSDSLELTVKGIPDNYPADKPWLPARSISLTENWQGGNIEKIKAGDSITRIVTVNADGLSSSQIPRPSMGNPEDIKIYPDQANATENANGSGLNSILQQAFALVPTKPAEIKLPEISYTWFNTLSHTVELAEIPEKSISVSGTTPKTSTQSDLYSQNKEKNDTTNTAFNNDTSTEPTAVSIWQLMTFLLLLALFIALGVIVYLKKKNTQISLSTQNGLIKLISKNKSASNEEIAFNKLIAACKLESPLDIRLALTHWLHTNNHIPTHFSLEESIQMLQIPELSQLVKQIDIQLFSNKNETVETINTKDLTQVIHLARKEIIKSAAKNTKDLLNTLNPL